MALKLGMQCIAYYGAAGSTATNELGNVRDVTISLETGEADVTTRSNDGWRATVGTLKEGTAEFEMIWDDTDAGFLAIKTAFFNATAIALCFLDGAGGGGLDADFSITKFTRTEPLEDAVKASVTAKPTYSTRAPSWV